MTNCKTLNICEYLYKNFKPKITGIIFVFLYYIFNKIISL